MMRTISGFVIVISTVGLAIGTAHASTWDPIVQHVGAAAAGQQPAQPPASPCASLRAGISAHIEIMKTLNSKIQQQRQTPPNLERMWESMTAAPQAPVDEEAKLANERRVVNQIATLLPPNKCPPVDIDAELKKPTLPETLKALEPKKSHHKTF